MKPIPLQLTRAGPAPQQAVEIDGGLVASRLGLEVEAFRQLMQDGKVSVLCERGIDADVGLYRATFYYGTRRFRAVVDASGEVVQADSAPAR